MVYNGELGATYLTSLTAREGLFSFKAGPGRGWEMDNKSSLKFERFHRTICCS